MRHGAGLVALGRVNPARSQAQRRGPCQVRSGARGTRAVRALSDPPVLTFPAPSLRARQWLSIGEFNDFTGGDIISIDNFWCGLVAPPRCELIACSRVRRVDTAAPLPKRDYVASFDGTKYVVWQAFFRQCAEH